MCRVELPGLEDLGGTCSWFWMVWPRFGFTRENHQGENLQLRLHAPHSFSDRPHGSWIRPNRRSLVLLLGTESKNQSRHPTQWSLTAQTSTVPTG